MPQILTPCNERLQKPGTHHVLSSNLTKTLGRLVCDSSDGVLPTVRAFLILIGNLSPSPFIARTSNPVARTDEVGGSTDKAVGTVAEVGGSTAGVAGTVAEVGRSIAKAVRSTFCVGGCGAKAVRSTARVARNTEKAVISCELCVGTIAKAEGTATTLIRK